ncbi:MAG: DUF3990 domain-containing protein [Fibromonadaceae bacterium]|jgi:hypothetical protein|nr:DUF3990 domain-containing protein [Fibromonadaceae bacterium]
MILYHGSLEIIEEPNPFIGRKNVDFGQGFYLTDLREQAVRWINRRKRQASQKKGFLNIYEYTENSDLKIKKFNGYCEEWLDFVILNRAGSDIPKNMDYDVVIGNVADDEVIVAVDSYIESLAKGRATKNTKLALLDELSFSYPNNQYAFKTILSLNFLKFINSEAFQ